MEEVDALIIGSGQGGVPFAIDLATEGKKTVLFERESLGGSCVNYGCTPSKAFLAAAHAAGRARKAKSLGIEASVRVDFPAVMERVRKIVGDFNSGVQQRLEKAGVRIVRAQARFTGERIVRAGGVECTAPLVVINTGTSALIPDIPGLVGTPYLDNKSFFGMRDLPKRLLVLGGGYIGLELGHGMARLGSHVTIFHRGERVLDREEADVSEALRQSLAEDGVEFKLRANVSAVSYADGIFNLQLQDGQTAEGEALLVATGRRPNTDGLDAQAGNVALDERGYVKVDERFRTTGSGVYAIGDVAGQPAFTHVSWEDYRRLKAILKGESRTRDDRVLGYAVYTEPQVGRAGLTLDEANAKGYRARALTYPMSSVARAIEWGETQGFYRLVVDDESGKILGATLVGYEAAELVHVFIAHMQAGSTWHSLDESVHIHPTYAEAFPSLARLFA
ncbi:MAG: FAD-dependent oxidoreductase [Candidatus Eremiobacteraeota bacterium]|nr:FAD-dependent oxidoreductase [Candidatus Eremiobacteraeota bacterium]MBC5827504.1 FAD-dependent oxidoreductase [Candidatus Eremiobacteraeota bacterium]